MKRILFMVEGVTLAHVGRSLRLASILHREGFDVDFACDSRYNRFLAEVDFKVRSIKSIPAEAFLDALARGRPVFSMETLSAYVLEDLSILANSGPDIVVGDFRLSLSVSARLAGIPYANVTNAYWSPYAKPRFRLPSLAFTPRRGVKLAEAVFRTVRPLAFAWHAAPMNRLRRAYGLSALGWDMRRAYCDGDLTLYADIPELIPIFGQPSTHQYIGPVLWSPPIIPPPWWSEVSSGEAPIYVSLGSSGEARLLATVVEALLPLGRPVVVATAGRGARLPEQARLWVTDFLPGEEIAARACVVVCNGGSPTSQQALLHGVPVLGIASNLDQYLNMDYVERFGAGLLIRADQASVAAVRGAAQRAISCARLRDRARDLAVLATRIRPDVQFGCAIRSLLGGEATSVSQESLHAQD